MVLWLPVQVAMVGTNLHNQRKSNSRNFQFCILSVWVCVLCVCEREREIAHVTTAKRALVRLATEFKETPWKKDRINLNCPINSNHIRYFQPMRDSTEFWLSVLSWLKFQEDEPDPIYGTLNPWHWLLLHRCNYHRHWIISLSQTELWWRWIFHCVACRRQQLVFDLVVPYLPASVRCPANHTNSKNCFVFHT